MRLLNKQKKKMINRTTRILEGKLLRTGSFIGFLSSLLYFVFIELNYGGQDLSFVLVTSLSGTIASAAAYFSLQFINDQPRMVAIINIICSMWGIFSVHSFFVFPSLLLLSSSFLCLWKKNRVIRLIK